MQMHAVFIIRLTLKKSVWPQRATIGVSLSYHNIFQLIIMNYELFISSIASNSLLVDRLITRIVVVMHQWNEKNPCVQLAIEIGNTQTRMWKNTWL